VNRVTAIAHPMVQNNSTRLRDDRTKSEEFRRGLAEVVGLMVYV
jgi:uracil phosphoribosyltransferase